MSELSPKRPTGISQEKEEERSRGNSLCRGPITTLMGFSFSGRSKPSLLPPTPPPREWEAQKMSDLARPIAQIRGMCRREPNGILGKENSPCKGLEAGECDAFEELKVQYASTQNTRR